MSPEEVRAAGRRQVDDLMASGAFSLDPASKASRASNPIVQQVALLKLMEVDHDRSE